MPDSRCAIARHFPPHETLVWFAIWIIPGAARVQTSFGATSAARGDPASSFHKVDSNIPLNVAPQFTDRSGQFRGKVAVSKPSWQFSGTIVSE
jgi:hypothetical protein